MRQDSPKPDENPGEDREEEVRSSRQPHFPGVGEYYPGWVIPRLIKLHGPEADCNAPGKQPIESGWYASADWREEEPSRGTTWCGEIERHLTRGNIGYAFPRWLVAADADSAAAVSWMDGLLAAEGIAEATPTQTTAHGAHYLFRLPDGHELTNTVKTSVAESVELDVRGYGAQIVVEPSTHATGKKYEWRVEIPDDPGDVPTMPDALLAVLPKRQTSPLDALPVPPPLPTPAPGTVWKISQATRDFLASGAPNHSRNEALFLAAADMAGCGYSREDAEAQLLAGCAQCSPPYSPEEARRTIESAWSQPRTPARPDAHEKPILLPSFQSVPELMEKFPHERPVVLDGLLREGDTGNIIAPPKTGKSWLAAGLSLSIATGTDWMGFGVSRGEVLLIDNELHGSTLTSRFPKVADAMSLDRACLSEIKIETLRGRLTPITEMGDYFAAIKPGRFRLIVIDALYRAMPPGASENDNATMAGVYNALDAYAGRLGCAFLLVHHSTKGNQAGKAVTDVGAGAGAQSRAVDAHIILREHQEEARFVLDAAARSFPPPEPRVAHWQWPTWEWEPWQDATKLRQANQSRTASIKTEDFVERYIGEPATRSDIEKAAKEDGIPKARVSEILSAAVIQGHATQSGRGVKGDPIVYSPPTTGQDSDSSPGGIGKHPGCQDSNPPGLKGRGGIKSCLATAHGDGDENTASCGSEVAPLTGTEDVPHGKPTHRHPDDPIFDGAKRRSKPPPLAKLFQAGAIGHFTKEPDDEDTDQPIAGAG